MASSCRLPLSRRSWHRVACLFFLCALGSLFVWHRLRHSMAEYRFRVSAREKRLLLNTLGAFMEALDSQNITYFLYGGSLLGSYRHHDLIPWDDDVDIMMNSTDKRRILEALAGRSPEYRVFVPPEGQWKFYYANTDTLPGRDHRWPYVDMFFFVENSTHIWDEVPDYGKTYVFRKAKVFPLTRRPFSALRVATPCDPVACLVSYDPEECLGSSYSHKEEKTLPFYKWVTLPCSRLAGRFPFVRHTRLTNGSWLEELVNGSLTLTSLVLPAYC